MRGRGDGGWRCAMFACIGLMVVVMAMGLGLGDVVAAELRKCTMAGGRAIYVSEACPAGSREVWQGVVEANPRHDVELKRRQDEIAQWQQASRREAALRQRPVSFRGSGRNNAEASSATRCERARQRRDRIRQKEWMRMTYDRMIQLDDEVREACR